MYVFCWCLLLDLPLLGSHISVGVLTGGVLRDSPETQNCWEAQQGKALLEAVLKTSVKEFHSDRVNGDTCISK